MKKIMIGLLALSSISVFAQSNIVSTGGINLENDTYIQKTCQSKVFEEVMSSKTIKAELQILLANAQDNLEKISAISRKAQDIAEVTCN